MLIYFIFSIRTDLIFVGEFLVKGKPIFLLQITISPFLAVPITGKELSATSSVPYVVLFESRNKG